MLVQVPSTPEVLVLTFFPLPLPPDPTLAAKKGHPSTLNSIKRFFSLFDIEDGDFEALGVLVALDKNNFA